MTDFAFTDLVNDPLSRIESAALGVAAVSKLTINDIGKAVKMAAVSNYVLTAGGNEIEGFVNSIEPFTVNDGFAFGGVKRTGRMIVTVGAAQAGALAVGAAIVSDDQAAVGTAGPTTGAARVKAGSPAIHIWRVIRHLSGTGVAGDSVLIERV